VRDAFLSSKSKSFRSPAALELLSLCVAKEKVTKEKGHPAWRLPGILPGKSVSRGRAFRQHIHVLAKRHRHPADAPFGACRPRLTAAQGSREERRAIVARTRCAAAAPLRERRGTWLSVFPLTSDRPERSRAAAESKGGACGCPSTSAFGLRSGRTAGAGGSASAFALAPSRVRARMARCSTGDPCAAVRRGRQAAQRALPGMATPFRAGRSPLEKPGPDSRTCRAWMPGKRQAGWPSLLVTFLLATQEKSDSSAAGDRKLLLLALARPKKASRLKSLPPTARARASRTTEGSLLWTGCAPTAVYQGASHDT